MRTKRQIVKKKAPFVVFTSAKSKGVGPIALKANRILSVNAEELKAWDILPTNTVCSTTASFTLLNGVPAGTDIWNRTGRKIMLKSIQVRGTILPTSTSVTCDRMMLIYDKQWNGATPVAADVLTSANSTGVSATALDFLNLTNRERFIVIRDAHWPNTSAQSAADPLSDQSKTSFDWFVDLRGLPTIFTVTGGVTAASIQTGALFLFFFSTSVTGAIVNFATRLRYTDA